jgi:hypothetical protein
MDFYQYGWDHQSFKNDGLQILDTISLIHVYEDLINAAIQRKKSPPWMYYLTQTPW